jgi:hypothetical protein
MTTTIAGYSLRAYKEHKAGMEGGGYTATILKDGRPVIAASNTGDGGCDRFVGFGKTAVRQSPEILEFTDTARGFAPNAPQSGYYEPDWFVSLLMLVDMFDKHARKIGATYDQVAVASINQEAFSYLRDWEKALLLDPSGRTVAV